VFDVAAKDIGVPGLVPHELRHTVQRLLGHETATMTLGLYSHLFSDDLTNVAKSLDKAAEAAQRQ
jgi:integrase